jgi:hypothetical protein
MLTISEAQRRTELFLTGQMLEALRAVEYGLPSFDTQLHDVDLAEVARACVEIRHVRGASDATYLINAFGEELLMQLQLNVHRLVVVYRVPALDALDASTLSGTSLPVSRHAKRSMPHSQRLQPWRTPRYAPATHLDRLRVSCDGGGKRLHFHGVSEEVKGVITGGLLVVSVRSSH